MVEFFQACLAFPTVVFSLFLCLALLYWLCVLLGALDIDLFDVDVEPDLPELETNADSPSLFADLLSRLDLTDIPLTVTLSLFVLQGWLLTFVALDLLGDAATTLALGSSIALGAGAISLLLTSRMARLLKPAFRTHHAPTRRSFVGRVCEITTLGVDETYGQAQLDDGGAGLVIQVRSSNASELARGSTALIFDYDADHEIFHVKPLEAHASLLDTGSDALPETT